MNKKSKPSAYTLPASQLQKIIDLLHEQGYTVIGPQRQDNAIIYDEITSTDALPAGWTDVQEGGTYQLQRRDDDAWFGYAVGPHSWKQFLFPAKKKLFTIERETFRAQAEPADKTRYAFLGVRSCELHAIAIQDKVFRDGPYADPAYSRLRNNAFFIAVNCTEPAATCFCSSMNTGPGAESGYDLLLTELIDSGQHEFLISSGSAKGRALLGKMELPEAAPAARERGQELLARAADKMHRRMDAEKARKLLLANPEHPHWQELGARCLSCANCTMVCPTCFCSTVEDVTSLTGDTAERWRRWDSCFTMGHSYIHGGHIRSSGAARYRQWLTHKLATWVDQFGVSGCVGCGRCITWCPVAIDVTEEITKFEPVTQETAA